MATTAGSNQMDDRTSIKGVDSSGQFNAERSTNEKVSSHEPRINSEKVPDLSRDVEHASGDVGEVEIHHPANQDDVLTHTIHLDDDPALVAITFRTLFIGVGLSIFGGVLSAIYYFKPQTVAVSTVFLAIISWVLGKILELIIPKNGIIGRWLNPQPFNVKEHLAIIIMANSASIAALGIELLAVQRLYYNAKLNGAISIFLLFSSQFLGYGITGNMRKTLVYPKAMLWPSNIPVNAMLETLHRPWKETRKGVIVFAIVFTAIFCWEIVPEWIMPILTGVSIFCLANQNSLVFTNIFGGASGNEGLGLFSLCLDWQYISGGFSPLYYPIESLINQGIGVCFCIFLFSGAYYTNLWNAKDFPFLSQVLFSASGNASNPVQWNQTAVIGSNNVVDPQALAAEGLPYFSTTYALNLLVTNGAITAGITHLLLYHWTEIKPALRFLKPSTLKHFFNVKRWKLGSMRSSESADENQENYDPHYLIMQNYKPIPDWWFGIVLVLSVIVGLVCIYEGDFTLPWWGFVVACLVAYVLILFFGSMQAITGIGFIVQPVVQMIGGYIQPGNPVANMAFVLYGYNAVSQGSLLAADLKLAQYGHLAPRVTFAMQMMGTLIGAIFNYIMMNSIVTNQREILLSIEGTNVWSGQNVQQFNSLAITWGGFPHQLFSIGSRYQWITIIFLIGFVLPLPFYIMHRCFPNRGFDKINTSLIIYFGGFLCVGINSSIMSFFIIGFTSQWFIRRRYPNSFVKYNYLVSAALDGGTSVIVFILSFAIFGAAGPSIAFPNYWGNNANGNFDRCLYTNTG